MDIHEELLLALPVKSLLRFKCVSKSWNSLISKSYFKRKHLNHTKSHGSRKMLISQIGYDKDHPFTFHSSSLSSIQLVNDMQRLDWPLNSKTTHARVCCCYDGLFLIGIWSKDEDNPSILLLWNPATRESIVLSYSEIPPIELSLYGLGYDSIINDYKVVRIDMYPDYTPDEILVLKSDSWKKITNETSGSICWVSASKDSMDGLVFLHGALHWFGWDWASYYSKYIIISFNISNEMYEEIPVPNEIHSFHSYPGASVYSYPGASVLGGMLCCHCNESGIFNLWAMKEYGVKESWIKFFTIPNEGMPIYRFPDGEVLLICNIVNNGCIGRIFRTSDGSFRLSNRMWPLDGDNINSSTLQDGFVYTESLISPKLNN